MKVPEKYQVSYLYLQGQKVMRSWVSLVQVDQQDAEVLSQAASACDPLD